MQTELVDCVRRVYERDVFCYPRFCQYCNKKVEVNFICPVGSVCTSSRLKLLLKAWPGT